MPFCAHRYSKYLDKLKGIPEEREKKMWNEKCPRWTEDKSAAFEIPKQKPWEIISFWAMLNYTRKLYPLNWVKNKDFEIKSICGILHIHSNNKIKLSLTTLSVTTSQLQFSDIVCYWKGRPEKGSIIFTNTESQVPTQSSWALIYILTRSPSKLKDEH